jgi:hypothetical protein
MFNDFWNYVVRRPRHPGWEAEQACVVLVRAGDAKPDRVESRLIDLSRGGMQVAASLPLVKGERLSVRLEHDNDKPLEVDAIVRWVRRAGDGGDWHVGLQFFADLELEALGELFLKRVLDGR